MWSSQPGDVRRRLPIRAAHERVGTVGQQRRDKVCAAVAAREVERVVKASICFEVLNVHGTLTKLLRRGASAAEEAGGRSGVETMEEEVEAVPCYGVADALVP